MDSQIDQDMKCEMLVPPNSGLQGDVPHAARA